MLSGRSPSQQIKYIHSFVCNHHENTYTSPWVFWSNWVTIAGINKMTTPVLHDHYDLEVIDVQCNIMNHAWLVKTRSKMEEVRSDLDGVWWVH